MGDFLTEIEQSIYRSSCGELMRIATIARPGAIRAASWAARTFEGVNEFCNNPIDFEEIAPDSVAKSHSSTHRGFRIFRVTWAPEIQNKEMRTKRTHQKSKNEDKTITHFKVRNLLYTGGATQ